MNYDDFRQLWHQVLQEAGLMQLHDRPTEAVELQDMTRRHKLYVSMGKWNQFEPFSVAARLDWTWDALLSTRGAWQGVDLPRQWDDPDRDYEEWPEEAREHHESHHAIPQDRVSCRPHPG